MKQNTGLYIILTLTSAVLLSLPWLVPGCGLLALLGFVPLLCAERVASLSGTRHFWLWHYGTFVLWNALTTFWVCNATVGGGIFAVLANALQMSLIFGIFRFSKRKLKGVLPYIFLMVMWIAWERFYFSAQISWPWLVLGNSFAASTWCIQWYEITGSLGGSLWIWATNLTVFGIMVALSDGSWNRWNRKARAALSVWAVSVFVFPAAASLVIGAKYEQRSEGVVDVLVGQPNFDPYTKFESMSQADQDESLLSLYRDGIEAGRQAPQLLLAPETFTSNILLNQLPEAPSLHRFHEFLRDYPRTDFLFGASTYDIYDQRIRPDIMAVPIGNRWIKSHNSAIMTDASARTEVYHKSRLVVGTEMMPFPKILDPIDRALGYVIGRCVGQDEISLLHLQDGTPFGCAICYESCYGEYCTGYVRKGAEFIAVITNDAWWGDTPGYKQHLRYSCLRAIELRRDIVRCGNTGISAFIDQKGRIVEKSQWWRPQTLRGNVNLNSERTVFVEYGDVVGRICVLAFLLILALLFVRTVSGGFRRER